MKQILTQKIDNMYSNNFEDLGIQIPHDIGCGYSFTDEDGITWNSKLLPPRTDKHIQTRTLHVSFGNYGYQHWYVKIRWHGIDFITDGDRTKTHTMNNDTDYGSIELMRVITLDDVKADNERFGRLHQMSIDKNEPTHTNAFMSLSDAQTAVKDFIEKWFIGDWKIESNTRNFNQIMKESFPFKINE